MRVQIQTFKARDGLDPSMLTVQNMDSNLRADTKNGLIDKVRYSFSKYNKDGEHRGDKERHKGIV